MRPVFSERYKLVHPTGTQQLAWDTCTTELVSLGLMQLWAQRRHVATGGFARSTGEMPNGNRDGMGSDDENYRRGRGEEYFGMHYKFPTWKVPVLFSLPSFDF